MRRHRTIDATPRRGQIIHQVRPRIVFKQAGILGLSKHTASESRRNEVDEFRTDHREVALNTGLVETFVVLIAPKYKFYLPAVFITSVYDFGIKVLIRFENDGAKGCLLSQVGHAIELVLLSVFGKGVLFQLCLVSIAKRVEESLAAQLRLLEKDGSIEVLQDALELIHLVRCNARIVSLERGEEVKIRTLAKLLGEDLPSFGVGRVRSLFVYPLSFQEFLAALGKETLGDLVRKASPENPLLPAVHETLTEMLRTFLVIGGMPEVVQEYVENHDLMKCQLILDELIASFQDDFRKYSKRIPEARINEVFNAVAKQGHGKFVYTKVGEGLKLTQVKAALNLLILAGLVYPVTHTAANGLPLGSEINERYRRMILLDTGFMQRMQSLDLRALLQSTDFSAVNRGAVAEVFVGTELIKAQSAFTRSALWCWHKEDSRSQAEVDYVVQSGDNIVPVEVKSGGKGAMQSMRVFLEQKHRPYGVRTSLENFSTYNNIRVYPLYAIGNLVRSMF